MLKPILLAALLFVAFGYVVNYYSVRGELRHTKSQLRDTDRELRACRSKYSKLLYQEVVRRIQAERALNFERLPMPREVK